MLWFHKKEIQRLPYVTDVHSHVVPGIDDGSPAVDRSLELLGRMSQWGITRVIPTPHVTEDTFENTPSTILPAWTALDDALKDAPGDGIGVELRPPAAEYRVDNFFIRQLDEGNVRPLSGQYLLIENGFHQEPWGFDDIVFDLRNRGYIPVLAHPERYFYYHSPADAYRRIASHDLLLQCNILSLAGYYGNDVRRVARRLVDDGLVSFLGTDLHHARHADAIDAYLSTSDFRNVAHKLSSTLLNDRI